jgi:hypothetical protein
MAVLDMLRYCIQCAEQNFPLKLNYLLEVWYPPWYIIHALVILYRKTIYITKLHWFVYTNDMLIKVRPTWYFYCGYKVEVHGNRNRAVETIKWHVLHEKKQS